MMNNTQQSMNMPQNQNNMTKTNNNGRTGTIQVNPHLGGNLKANENIQNRGSNLNPKDKLSMNNGRMTPSSFSNNDQRNMQHQQQQQSNRMTSQQNTRNDVPVVSNEIVIEDSNDSTTNTMT